MTGSDSADNSADNLKLVSLVPFQIFQIQNFDLRTKTRIRVQIQGSICKIWTLDCTGLDSPKSLYAVTKAMTGALYGSLP